MPIMNNEGKGESMVQINGEQVEASKVVGKTLLAYVTAVSYTHLTLPTIYSV